MKVLLCPKKSEVPRPATAPSTSDGNIPAQYFLSKRLFMSNLIVVSLPNQAFVVYLAPTSVVK